MSRADDKEYGKMSGALDGLSVLGSFTGAWWVGERLKEFDHAESPWGVFIAVILLLATCSVAGFAITKWGRDWKDKTNGPPPVFLHGKWGIRTVVYFGLGAAVFGFGSLVLISPAPGKVASLQEEKKSLKGKIEEVKSELNGKITDVEKERDNARDRLAVCQRELTNERQAIEREKPRAVIVDKRESLATLATEFPRLARFHVWLSNDWPDSSLVMMKGKPFEKATTPFKVAVTPTDKLKTLYAFRVIPDSRGGPRRLEVLDVGVRGDGSKERLVSIPACEKGEFLLVVAVLTDDSKVQFGDVVWNLYSVRDNALAPS